jgi:hypothetical protein
MSQWELKVKMKSFTCIVLYFHDMAPKNELNYIYNIKKRHTESFLYVIEAQVRVQQYQMYATNVNAYFQEKRF